VWLPSDGKANPADLTQSLARGARTGGPRIAEGTRVLSIDAKRAWAAPFAIGAYIAAAYWFTASTSFANPAVTLARGFTATFAGIGLGNVPGFIVSQLFGAALALAADRGLRQNP